MRPPWRLSSPEIYKLDDHPLVALALVEHPQHDGLVDDRLRELF